MLPQQREAVFTISAWVAGLVLVPVLGHLFRPLASEITFGVMAIVIVAVWICRAALGVRWKKLDERDQLVRFKAGMAAAAAVVTLVVVGCLALYYLFHARGNVPLRAMPAMAFGAMASLYVCWTASILILYRRGG